MRKIILIDVRSYIGIYCHSVVSRNSLVNDVGSLSEHGNSVTGSLVAELFEMPADSRTEVASLSLDQ